MDTLLLKAGIAGYIITLAPCQLPLFGLGEQLGLAGAATCFAVVGLWGARSRYF